MSESAADTKPASNGQLPPSEISAAKILEIISGRHQSPLSDAEREIQAWMHYERESEGNF